MLQQAWTSESRRITACIDSYENGILKGRLCSVSRESDSFESLVQFLLRVEALLEDQQIPQSYTVLRKFADNVSFSEQSATAERSHKGSLATFDLQVLYRQHTSWQGVLLWRDRNLEQSFRSALELVLLMDSALRTRVEGVA